MLEVFNGNYHLPLLLAWYLNGWVHNERWLTALLMKECLLTASIKKVPVLSDYLLPYSQPVAGSQQEVFRSPPIVMSG